MILPDEDVGLREELFGEVVDVSLGVDYFLDPCVDEYLGAHRTRVCGGVDRTVLDTHSEVCGLNDSILLRVDTSA